MMDVRPALVLFTAFLVACGGPAAALPRADLPVPRVIESTAGSADLTPSEDEISMEIIELICRPCASRIVGKARQLPGVTDVSMFLASKTLTIRYDTAVTARDRVIAAVEQIVASIQ